MNSYNKKNQGFSLIEMLVAVAILSIVMLSVGGIMFSMSKSFSQSQKEVQLQDTVQTTYSIVSNIMKEAQIGKNSTVACVQFDKNVKRLYIIDDDTNEWKKSQFHIVEFDSSNKKLYLYKGDLYDTKATEKGTMTNFKGVPSKTVRTAQYLLANNVKDFQVDDSSYADGYVVLAIELKYGDRKANMSQNVYLRNSNNSVLASGSNGGPVVDPMEGYKLVSISSISCSKNPYSEGSTPIATDFTLTGNYVNENDPEDSKTAPVTVFECDKLGKPLNNAGNVTFTFTVPETDISKDFVVTVNPASLDLKFGSYDVAVPGEASINTHSEINVYFRSMSKDTTAAISNATESYEIAEDSYVCAACGGHLDWNTPGQSFKNCGTSGCKYQYTWANLGAASVKEQKKGTYTKNISISSTGSGVFSIINDSDTTDYKNVKVFIYIKNPNSGFTLLPDKGKFLSVNAAGTNATRPASYSVTCGSSDNFTKYIEIDISEMPKGNGKDYTTYTFNYKWACEDNLKASDVVMAVYMENGGI